MKKLIDGFILIGISIFSFFSLLIYKLIKLRQNNKNIENRKLG